MNGEKATSASAAWPVEQFEAQEARAGQARSLNLRDLLANQVRQHDCEHGHEELSCLLRAVLSESEAHVIELLADGFDPISFASDSNLVSESEAAALVETALQKLSRCPDRRLTEMLCQRCLLGSPSVRIDAATRLEPCTFRPNTRCADCDAR